MAEREVGEQDGVNQDGVNQDGVNQDGVGQDGVGQDGVDQGLDPWEAAFVAFHARFAPHFFRQEARQRSARYLRALLGPLERKNGWQVAEAAGEAQPDGMQRLLNQARWDAEAVRDALQRFVLERFGDADGVLILDETGFVKKGTKSVGVQRQYSGTAGKVENCQIGVFLAYASCHGHVLVDRALYLPREWATDALRRQEAAVPETVTFQTKPELGWALLERAQANGLEARWVLGDTVYGNDPRLRARLDSLAPGSHYLLAVASTTPAWTTTEESTAAAAPTEAPRDASPQIRWQGGTVAAVVAALPETAWQRLMVAEGAKGPRVFDWAARRVAVGEQGWPGAEQWLLVRQSTSDPAERAYYLSNAPADTTLATLARVAARRWPIEQCFEEAKGEAGLDQYEVRRWDSWQRHITLAILAHAFLADLKRQGAGGKSGPDECGGADRTDRAGGAAAAGSGAAVAPTLARGALGLVTLAPLPPSAGQTLSLPTTPQRLVA
jgi:SRSO17 transposase